MTRTLVSTLALCALAAAADARTRATPTGRSHGLRAPIAPITTTIEPLFEGELGRRFYEVRFRLGAGWSPAGAGIGAPLSAVLEDPTLYEACRRDRFFVHFAGSEWPEAAIPANAAAFTGALGAALRLDGWAFEHGGSDLSVRPAALPTALRALRTAAHVAIGEDGGRAIRVGRVCTFQGQGAIRAMSQAQRDWHQRRLDPEYAAVAASDALYVGPPLVDVALVDTGVVAELVGATEVAIPLPFGDAIGGPVAAHGTWMGLLIREMLPTRAVDVRSYRVLDSGGSGTTHDLAAGLHAALLGPGTDSGRPLVISLSLGWAPELGQPRTLRARPGRGVPETFATEAVEDGVGSAVRELLDLAHDEALSGRPVMVVTAAGNRTRFAPEHQRMALGAGSGFEDPCWDKFGGQSESWFLPGEWAHTPTCDAGDEVEDSPTQNRWTSTTVSAVRHDDRPASVSREGMEAPLVAPGQHVVVERVPGFGDGVELPSQIEVPIVLTGTSVAAALTAAAVARAQVEAILAGHPPIPWAASAQLLHLSGTDTGREARPFLNTTHAHRLDVCALRRAATCECEDGDTLSECVYPMTGQQTPVSGAATLCAPCWESCLAQDPCPAVRIAPPAPSVAWLSSGAPEITLDAPVPCTPDGDGACPSDYAEVAGIWVPVVDQYLAGDVGPQPGEPICPDCSGLLDLGGQTVVVTAPMRTKATDVAAVVGVSLVVRKLGQTVVDEVAIPKSVYASWAPGGTMKFAADVSPALAAVPGWALTFELETSFLTYGSQKPVGDSSPLMTKTVW